MTLRWHAVITYRTENGPVDIEHDFEELEELHDIVERGPSWYALINIVVTVASVREHEQVTVEAAERM